ncbi:hypothetical protein BTH160X_50051 [Brochothrix thermosphacta]|uniref:Uncharacterized protein n=1 Tax=Brochothrix thermosphacta TaxID=2756 RepID=A0A2X0QD43_BROTH|nr:hypothetical protein BTH160X_50051 [Brochothrix thermosphacta]SPP26599.1 conserved hypothetical protein [Brochothrix thermosphacta]
MSFLTLLFYSDWIYMNYRFNLIVSVGFCQPDDLLCAKKQHSYLECCLMFKELLKKISHFDS